MFRRRRRDPDPSTLDDLVRLAPPARHDDLRRLAARKGVFRAVADSGRWFVADAEDLAEGGAADFLRELQPALRALGAAFDAVQDGRFDASVGQSVVVDGAEHSITTAEEALSDNGWALAAVRTFRLVNARLQAAGSPERLHAVHGGNDLHAVFLTPALVEALADELDPADRPYVPTEEDPDGLRRRGG